VSAIVVVGDTLLDRDVLGSVTRLSPDAPVPVVDQETVRSRPGGAALAAVLAAADATSVTLVTALGDDACGAEVRAMLGARDIDIVDLGLGGTTPEKLRIGPPGRPLLRLDRGGGGAVGEPDAVLRATIGWADTVLVSDYGRGVAATEGIRALLAGAAAPVVWDPHPRGATPTPGAALVTPNLAEARGVTPDPPGAAAATIAGRARALAARWRADAVCVTCGADGAVLVHGDGPAVVVHAEPTPAADPCGAGDRFASCAAAALARGASTIDAVRLAVDAATRFVAAGGAGAIGAPDERRPSERSQDADAIGLAERVRARGGTVVATGGCFDLLHPGHIRSLEAARALGDCLVVCINSDASVRRLKGAGRPIVGAEDRAAILRALACVDAVLVFGEDTPATALQRLRPDVWAKGGDYTGRELPEAAVVAEWGGEVVLLPFVDGKSSTRIIKEASLRAIG
jgi:D-beta-D-heptose 7-phosphate kinase/D-beta-D-heptose 1-phosphate adenosyltransferase